MSDEKLVVNEVVSDKVVADKIVAKELDVKHIRMLSAPYKIEMSVISGGVGIWLTKANTKEMVSIYFAEGQGAVVALGNPDKGYDIAFAHNGEPIVQLQGSGETKTFTVDEVIKKLS